MIKLIIADDHPIVREGLKQIVSEHGDFDVVCEAGDGIAALNACRKHAADVILLDVSMPGPGVLDLIRRIRSLRPAPHILVLSVHPEQLYARRVLKAGADGYLTKDHSPHALASAIRQVRAGRKYITPQLAEELAIDLSRGSIEHPHEALSNREYEVLLQIGRGLRIDEIAQGLKLSPKTVRTYRSRILDKMNAKSTAELIFYAIHKGLVTDVVCESSAASTPSSTDEIH